MEIYSKTISNFFTETLSDIKCEDDTKAYIISIFSKYKISDHKDLSQDNLTIRFCQARSTHNFLEYQILADYIFYTSSIHPASLHDASKDYYDEIAKLSYLSCYNLINKQWKLYYEMSTRFNFLENQVKSRLEKVKVQKYIG